MSRLRPLRKFPSLFSGILIGLLAVVVAGNCALAQPRELAIGEQPGIVPNPREERLGAVGRAGCEWQGLLRVTRKAEWPDWSPSPDLLRRQPELPRSMRGGPGNPYGA